MGLKMKTKVLTNNNNFIFWSGLVNKIYNIYRFSYNKRKISLLNIGNDQNCYDLRYLYGVRFSTQGNGMKHRKKLKIILEVSVKTIEFFFFFFLI